MKQPIRLYFLLLALLLSAVAHANPITWEQAQQNALSFLQEKGKNITISSLRHAQLRSGSTTPESYYVFNIGNNDGYVVAAGDDCAPVILGYAESGYIDMDSLPANMKEWLEEYAQQIQFMRENGYSPSKASILTSNYSAISPLLATTWDQLDPYNQNCPDFFSYGKCVTGCVATAMAQVMYYHRARSVTQTTTQIPAYTCRHRWNSGTDTMQIHVAAIPAGSPIDWDNMLDSYGSSATTTQEQAVANLMKYCGASVQMDYANEWNGGSGAYSTDVPTALKTYFDYSSATVLKNRSDYSTNDAWESLIYNELSNSRPVYYSGRNNSAGHAFVCDGYDGSGYYHINWGWSGTSDGFFLLTALDPNEQGTGGSSSGYNQNQAALIYAEPKSTTPSNPVLATSISLNKTSAELNTGETMQLTATVLPSNATNKTVTWSTSNSSVATVNSNGLVTAKATGSVTITVRTTDGTNLSASCQITIKEKTVLAASISLNKTSAELNTGETLPLTATVLPSNATNKTVTWSTSNSSVATVNGDGSVTAKAAGSATITVRTTDGTNLSAYCSVTVKQNTQSNIISFVDAYVKTICVQNWDTNGDGELSTGEAAVVTSLGTVFKSNVNITSFDELQYFTRLTSIGERAFYGCNGLTSITIPSSVTSIGERAFFGCSGLTSITIPSSVTSIGDYAFRDCSGLTSITIPSSVTSIGDQAFWGCSGLTSITIPSSVTSIGDYAFCDCSGLTSITIPSSVTSIGGYAFAYCSGLTNITVDSDNSVYDSRNNCNAIIKKSNNQLIVGCKNTIIPSSVTSIGSSAFEGCSGLTSITIPSSVTSIGGYAFSDCSGLTSITIPSSVTSIGERAFYGCYGLTSITILEGVTSIGSLAFRGCSGLTSITIPSSVTSIGGSAFAYCSGLTNITVDSDNSVYDSRNNCNAIIRKSNNQLIVGCENTIIPSSVTSIGNSAFYGCNGLISITIPSSVTSIGDYAFAYCSGLNDVYSYISNPSQITMGSGVFYQDYDVRTLHVPVGSLAVYQADQKWSEYFGSIVEMAPILATSIELNETSAEMTEGDTMQLTATVLPSNATNKTVAWSTSNSSVATVNSNGLVTAKATGSATITVRTTDGTNLSAYCSVTVKQNTQSNIISFVDAYVKTICVQNWDTNGDGELSIGEAAEVTNLGTVFQSNVNITSFDELQYFTRLTSIGERAFYGCYGLTSITIPSSVTSIGGYAFWGCSGLTSITIPSSVTSIGNLAFYGCYGLTSITIPSSVTSIGISAFFGCSGLTSITIPSSVTRIGDLAFWGCSGLTSITIPSSVTYIGTGVFGDCSGLTSITIPSSVTCIEGSAFSGCSGLTYITVDSDNSVYDSRNNCNAIIKKSNNQLIVGCKNTIIPSSVTSIGYYAFEGCSGLTSITIPSSVTSIGGYAFAYCSGLTSITIPSSVTSIGNSAFAYCSGLTNITVDSDNSVYDSRNNCNAIIRKSNNQLVVGCKNTIIPSSVTSIGSAAFYGCSGLTSITIPSSVTSIGKEAFFGCSGLTSITIPSSVTSIGDYAFYGCSGLTSITILEGVTSIGSSAFSGCSGLTSITIPSSVTSIGDYAFSSCSGLTSITIPSSVTSIGDYAFRGCSGLTSITIPSSVTSIGDYAFEGCSGLNDVYSYISNPSQITMGNFVFYLDSQNYAVRTLHVPVGSLAVYQADQKWSEYFGSIVEMDPILATSIELNETSAEMTEGDTMQLTATIQPNNATNKTVTWSTSNSSVATVNSNGLVTAIATGSATITARTTDGTNLSASCQVTIKEKTVLATSISLNKTSAELNTGETLQLTATVLPSNATNKTVTWTTNNSSVATVNSDGVVTAIFSGTATITARTTDGTDLSASCVVTVISDQVNYDNYLSINDTAAFHGETIVIPVKMTNETNIISFQTDIFLPEGLELMQEDGEYMIDPSPRMTRTHTIMSNDVSSDAIRVICYSSNYKSFTGNSGDDLFYLNVKVADDAEGDYTILLKNTLLTNTDFVDLAAPDVAATVNVKAYLLGDANNSGSVTITDVVVTAQHVLELNPQPFVFEAADANIDGNITVADVSRIAWMVLNPTLNAPRRAPALWNNGDRMSAEDITLAAGETRRVSIMLNNDMDYSAFQLDLNLPEGMTASNFQLTDRAGSHAFDVNTLLNGNIRALCYSPALTAINGHEGALLTFDVTAAGNVNGNILIDGIELVTTGCQSVKLDAFTIGVNNASSINEPITGKAIAKVEYFNLAGQRMEQPSAGVTLIVTTYTDGSRTTTKVIK